MHRAIPIGEYSKWLVASPDFVGRYALPATIEEAADLPFVGLSVLAHPSRVKVNRADGTLCEVDFSANLLADTVYACRAAIAEGAGIGLLPDYSVRADFASGRLIRFYADWSTTSAAIHALLPPGKHTAPKVRVLLVMLKAEQNAADGAGARKPLARS
jgi:DNA-binding transcriptional LysR family regulator